MSDVTTSALLRRVSLRRTPVRTGVLDVLSRSDRPLSVTEILAKMKGLADTVTVYRTLHTFVRKKLVHRVRGGDRSWLYAMSRTEQKPQHLHPHFVCDECGKVECLEEASVPATLVPSLGVGGEYKVRWPEVVLHGVCPRCRS